MSLINKEKFEKNKDYIFQESVYVLCKTGCCGKFCVMDSAVQEVFFNSKDFNAIVLINNEAKCPFCAADKLKVIVIKDISEVKSIKTGWEAYYN